jgi:hypothetical protein
MNVHLIEPDRVAAVSVTKLPADGDGLEKYKVIIENDKPYIVGFSEILLASSEHHNSYLATQDNRESSAIRARRLRTGKTEPGLLEKILIGWGDWEKIKPRKVEPNDIPFEEAKKIIGRLLYRIAEQPYEAYEKSFKPWDLRVSLDFDSIEGVLQNFQNRGFIAYYSDASGNQFTDRWIVTAKGIEYFEKQIKEETEARGIVSRVSPSITSKVVEKAIADAETLLKSSGATSGVDRIHTALQGHLIAVCEKAGIKYGEDPSLTDLFKLLRSQHPTLQSLGPRSQDISKVLNSLANILDALNPLRNKASIAHPNPDLLAEEEAFLVINTAKTLLHYLDAKFSKV